MPEKKILIVEDERVVAEDLKRLLMKMGYAVTGVAASADEALEKVRAVKPDLVLMDIRIQGPRDGIETAEHLYAEHDVPVSYLTAYADASTLERAKATMPFGYVLKPFEARSLQTVIELALHRHAMESVLGGMDGWASRAFGALPDAVVGIDGGGRVIFVNKAAEVLTGWSPEGLFGRPLADVLSNGGAEGAGSVRTKGGASVPVKYTRSALPGEDGEAEGALIVLKKT